MKTKFLFLPYLTIFFLLTACAGNAGFSDAEIQATTAAVVQETLDAFQTNDSQEATEAPPTPTPAEPAQLVFMWDETQVGAAEADVLKSSLLGFAETNGLVFTNGLQNDPPAGSLIVAYLPNTGLAELAAGVDSTVQILGIAMAGGIPEGQEHRVTLLNLPDDAMQGFIAGYLSAISTVDYRVGILTQDTPAGTTQRDAFVNGAVYFCGLCLPKNPPYSGYPIFYSVPAKATDADLQAAADYLIAQSINTIYLAPGTNSPALEAYLDSQGIAFINTNPSRGNGHWVASVSQKLSVIDVVELILESGAQGTIQARLLIRNNAARISDARVENTKTILGKISDGFIDPLGD